MKSCFLPLLAKYILPAFLQLTTSPGKHMSPWLFLWFPLVFQIEVDASIFFSTSKIKVIMIILYESQRLPHPCRHFSCSCVSYLLLICYHFSFLLPARCSYISVLQETCFDCLLSFIQNKRQVSHCLKNTELYVTLEFHKTRGAPDLSFKIQDL